MAIRVALNDQEGDGARYAILKDVDELTAGDRRTIRGAVPLTLASDGKTLIYPGDYDDQMKNALLARVVTDWNLQYPVPNGDAAVFDKLTIDQVDRLYEAVEPHVAFLNGGVANPAKAGSVPNSGSAS